MLILTRRMGEALRIGADVSVTVLGIKGNQAVQELTPRKTVAVHREEIFQRIAEEAHSTRASTEENPGEHIQRVPPKH